MNYIVKYVFQLKLPLCSGCDWQNEVYRQFSIAVTAASPPAINSEELFVPTGEPGSSRLCLSRSRDTCSRPLAARYLLSFLHWQANLHNNTHMGADSSIQKYAITQTAEACIADKLSSFDRG